MILLDTSVLIDFFRKVNKQNAQFYKLAQLYDEFAISSITKYEVEVGSKQQDLPFRQALYSIILIIPFDDMIATETAKINQELKRKNQLIEFADMAIAATARINDFELATLNIKYFDRIEYLKLVNPI